jgi:hypothetical protein
MSICKSDVTGILSLIVSGCLFCSCAAAAPAASSRSTPEIATFQDCVKVTHRVLRTFPAQCVTADGKVFVDTPAGRPIGRLCVDQCGNGNCEEMVCMGETCPCAESVDSCPADCKK